jgi:flagellum-specific ATP synthase
MERAIAERGRYPAINVLKSVSRSMPKSANPDFLDVLSRARRVMATYADMEELIRLGAYRPGSSAEVDEAIGFHPQLKAFLSQDRTESTSLLDGYQNLAEVLAGHPVAAPGTPTGPKP